MTLAAVVSVSVSNGAYAGADPLPAAGSPPDTAEKPAKPIDELKEVWVRGKRLSQVIEDAEDDFFDLYNKLNKDSQYDVYCGSMSLYSSSMIMVRKCVPGFIAFNYGDAFGRVRYTQFGGASYGGFGYSDAYAGGYSRFGDWGSRPDMYFSGYADEYAFGPAIPVFAGPSSAEMLMSKRPAYAANVLKVVKSDPRLLEKVRALDGLYGEMQQVQGHYVKVKGEVRASRKPVKPYLTPRHL
jgi:hypothetical protein